MILAKTTFEPEINLSNLLKTSMKNALQHKSQTVLLKTY